MALFRAGIGCQGLGSVPARKLSLPGIGELLASWTYNRVSLHPSLPRCSSLPLSAPHLTVLGFGLIVNLGGGVQSPS